MGVINLRYIDKGLYEVLLKEQLLLTSDINVEMANLITDTEYSFKKKNSVPSFDTFYLWMIK